MIVEEVSICFITDTHNRHDFTPKPADVLIHTGDMTMYGYPDEIAEGLLWLQRQPHRHKAWLPGNHDMAMESDGFHRAMEMLVPGGSQKMPLEMQNTLRQAIENSLSKCTPVLRGPH